MTTNDQQVRLDLSGVPTEDLLAEIQRRITLSDAPPPIGHRVIPPPLRREQAK